MEFKCVVRYEMLHSYQAIIDTVIVIFSLVCNCHEVIKILLHCCKVIGSVELKLLLPCCTEVTAWTEKLLAIW